MVSIQGNKEEIENRDQFTHHELTTENPKYAPDSDQYEGIEEEL